MVFRIRPREMRRKNGTFKKEETIMKRTISLVFALVFALSALWGAALAEETFITPHFTLPLPDGWISDTTEADQEFDEEGIQYLGVLYEDKAVGLVVKAYLQIYEDWKDVSLWNADDATIKEFADALMDEYPEDHPEYLGVLMAGKIPFVMIRGEDKDGEYVYAETMTNGNAVLLFAFVADEEGNSSSSYPLTGEYIELLKTIVKSFLPVT